MRTARTDGRPGAGIAGVVFLPHVAPDSQGGVDEDVAMALEGKDETQAALVEALKARIERVSA